MKVMMVLRMQFGVVEVGIVIYIAIIDVIMLL